MFNGGSNHGINIIVNWTIVPVEDDRSVNKNGLQVYGTITKSAVATGADLVGYSGFSNTSYLEQPYNSDLNMELVNVSSLCWFMCSSTSGNTYIFERSLLVILLMVELMLRESDFQCWQNNVWWTN